MSQPKVKAEFLGDYLTVIQVAEMLGVHFDTFRRWRQHGDAPPETRIGKTPYFSREGVMAWIKSKEQKPKARGERRAPARNKGEQATV